MKRFRSISAFLGEETAFEGDLTFTGTLRIDGNLKGSIKSCGVMIVGEKALIEADINVTDAIICGCIRGRIIAENMIEILPSGKVWGDIEAADVTIHPGAVFEGKCITRRKEEKEHKID